MNSNRPSIDTVRLEILRHGKAHNQLLSPGVPYLVLCGDEPAASVEVPYEHRQLVREVRGLRYQEEGADRLERISEVVTEILGRVPRLAKAIGSAEGAVHLRLVLSPRELAMLPFESASTPASVPGGGPLLINPAVPVCLTREVRSEVGSHLRWPREPRVLLIASAAGGAVPVDAHVLAMLQVLDPWIHPDGTQGRDWRRRLTVLLDPTIAQIGEAVKRASAEGERYTHVHLLAHGGRRAEGVESRFGVVLHDVAGAREVIDGDGLASALAAGTLGGPDALPTVVTLATCDVGSAGDVLEPAAGLAQELHVAGVPLVVTSQYPLTQRGSVALVDVLYRELFEGGDPRTALIALRRALYASRAGNHDWVSLVAYARLPSDLSDQVEELMVASALARQRAALHWAESGADGGARVQGAVDVTAALATRAYAAWEAAPSERARERFVELARALGSALKRMAFWDKPEAERRSAEAAAAGDAADAAQIMTDGEAKAVTHLRRALDWYERAHDLDVSEHWSGCQTVSLRVVLGDVGEDAAARWTASLLAARLDLLRPGRRIWALSDLIELGVLGVVLPIDKDTRRRALDEALEHVRALVRHRHEDRWIVVTTVRQLRRYLEGIFPHLMGADGAAVERATRQVLGVFARMGVAEAKV
jgi:hypothetical protein